jgi:hypothetical protein
MRSGGSSSRIPLRLHRVGARRARIVAVREHRPLARVPDLRGASRRAFRELPRQRRPADARVPEYAPKRGGNPGSSRPWSTIGGKVDSNGDESIGSTDCTFGLIGQTVDVGLGDATDGADILGSDAGCGFAGSPLSSTLNGLVDLNSDEAITAADSCTNGCFFGHNVTNGIVQGGGAAPTITSFAPTAGPVGTTVTITGTNLTGATSVKFNGVSATITSNTATQIVTKVPTGATTGPITVTTAGGTATSATNFTVTGPPHARTISLRLRDALVARGTVTVTDGFAACADSVPVKVQRRVSGHWKTVKSTTTSSTGTYRIRLRNRHGRYRSVAPMVVKGTDTCGRAVSPTRRH